MKLLFVHIEPAMEMNKNVAESFGTEKLDWTRIPTSWLFYWNAGKTDFWTCFWKYPFREFQEFHYFEESPDPEVVDGILEPPIGINAEKCFV